MLFNELTLKLSPYNLKQVITQAIAADHPEYTVVNIDFKVAGTDRSSQFPEGRGYQLDNVEVKLIHKNAARNSHLD